MTFELNIDVEDNLDAGTPGRQTTVRKFGTKMGMKNCIGST